jgi:hypothetical protein
MTRLTSVTSRAPESTTSFHHLPTLETSSACFLFSLSCLRASYSSSPSISTGRRGGARSSFFLGGLDRRVLLIATAEEDVAIWGDTDADGTDGAEGADDIDTSIVA